MLIYIDLAD